LVSDSRGDLGYQFRLHGAAVLTGDSAAFDDLQSIYRLRSKAAHGGSSKYDADFEKTAPRARRLLALAVQSIAILIDNGSLTVGKERIGPAIADLVRRRATGLEGSVNAAATRPAS
jgi:hypothetical protein